MMRTSGLILIGSLLFAGAATAQTAGDNKTSVNDRKHVDALYDAQDFSGPTLTRDQIAAYRADTGWGNAFKQMQADGYFQGYKNFGQVVSGSQISKIEDFDTSSVKTDQAAKSQKLNRVSRVKRPDRPKRPKRR